MSVHRLGASREELQGELDDLTRMLGQNIRTALNEYGRRIKDLFKEQQLLVDAWRVWDWNYLVSIGVVSRDAANRILVLLDLLEG